MAYIEASKLRAGREHEADPRKLIRDYLVQRVEQGAVRSRADVVSALEEVGLEVPRQGKDYLTARDPDSGKRWRLKGELYEHDFHPERLDLPAAKSAGDRPAADRGDGRARVGISGGSWATMHWLWKSIELRIETLATLNLQIEEARWTLAEIEETTWGVNVAGDRRGARRSAVGRDAGRSALDLARSACREAVERVREQYERVGTAVDGGLGEVVRTVRDGTAAALRASRSLAAANRAADRSERNLAAACRAARRTNDTLGRVLQAARRDIARQLDLTRQRGREPDHGPSR